MVERRRLPERRVVALRTIMTEQSRHMVRVRCLLELRLVTLVAIRVLQLVVTARMTRLTLHGHVCPRQREASRAMIKCRSSPV